MHIKKIKFIYTKITLLVLIIIFYSTNTQALVFNSYTIGDKIKNEVVLDKRLTLPLSSGEWEIVEKENWCYYAFCGKFLWLGRLVGNEIAETYRLAYLDTAGKRISDVNIWIYKILFTNKHDGCYKRPEYYRLELYHKGATVNCMILGHIDVNKELYNPDDKTLAYLDAKLIRWIEDNSIEIPKIVLQSSHVFFSKTVTPRYYVVGHSITPKFFDGPKIEFFTEDSSEYHPLNISKFPKHKKFMDEFVSNESLFHNELEDKIRLKQRQKLDLSKNIIGGNTSISDNNDTIDKLNKLNDLYKSGVLTEEEFKKAKKKILN